MNGQTQKIVSFCKKIWINHKIPVVLGGVLLVTSLSVAMATCGGCGS